MIQDITTLISAIICLWLGAELLSAGDAPLGCISIVIGIVILAIRSDANRRNAESRKKGPGR